MWKGDQAKCEQDFELGSSLPLSRAFQFNSIPFTVPADLTFELVYVFPDLIEELGETK